MGGGLGGGGGGGGRLQTNKRVLHFWVLGQEFVTVMNLQLANHDEEKSGNQSCNLWTEAKKKNF